MRFQRSEIAADDQHSNLGLAIPQQARDLRNRVPLGIEVLRLVAPSLHVGFRLIAEVLSKQVPADASFGSERNAEEPREVRIVSVVPIHWDRAALLRRPAVDPVRDPPVPRQRRSRPTWLDAYHRRPQRRTSRTFRRHRDLTNRGIPSWSAAQVCEYGRHPTVAARIQVELGEDASDVLAHGGFADEKPLRDRAVRQALSHQAEHLVLT